MGAGDAAELISHRKRVCNRRFDIAASDDHDLPSVKHTAWYCQRDEIELLIDGYDASYASSNRTPARFRGMCASSERFARR